MRVAVPLHRATFRIVIAELTSDAALRALIAHACTATEGTRPNTASRTRRGARMRLLFTAMAHSRPRSLVRGRFSPLFTGFFAGLTASDDGR
jgi:hypothetical protein